MASKASMLRAARIRTAIDRYVCAIRPGTPGFGADYDHLVAIAADDLDQAIACVLDEVLAEAEEAARS